MEFNSNFSFGKYNPINSFVHRLNPHFKFLIMIMMVVTIFLNTGVTGYIVISSVTFIVYFASKLKARNLLTLLKPLIFMGIILFIINWFTIKGDINIDNGPYSKTIIHAWGEGHWYALSPFALYQTMFIFYRIYLMMLWTSILTSTTSPIELTLALEDLMWPGKLIRLPVHEIAMMIAIALRFIPTLIDESHKIMKAQASRGIDFENGKFNEKTKSLISLIIPLFVSSFQKAEDLANAMEARGYDPKAKRTRYRKTVIRVRDVSFFIFFLCLFTFCILWTALPFLRDTVYIPYIDIFKYAHAVGS